MLEKCIIENFMDERHRKMWNFVYQATDVLPAIQNAETWNTQAIHFATKT